jgi:hypothetical protein
MQTQTIDNRRRRVLGAAVATIAAAQFSVASRASSQATTGLDRSAVFGPPKQVDAGVLNVGYVEAGVPNGPTVILLHGWPYDIHSFVEVVPLLAAVRYGTAAKMGVPERTEYFHSCCWTGGGAWSGY